jgi:polyisoprenoid-binding protein YceI
VVINAMTTICQSGVLLWLALLPGPVAAWAQDSTVPSVAPQLVAYTIIERASLLQVHVYKAGLLGGLGHEHEVRAHGYAGTVAYDVGHPSRSRVSLTVPTDSLEVVIAGDSSDIPAITKHMREDVLHVDRFPEIRFTGSAVVVRDSTLHLRGDLTMEGVTRPVEMDLRLEVTPEILHVRGSFTVKQTDFGIAPYGTALGTVKVKNDVTFTLDIRAVAER